MKKQKHQEMLSPEDFDSKPHAFDFLKDRCKACWKLNKDRRKPRRNAQTMKLNLCGKHKNAFWKLFNTPEDQKK